jgi:transposase
MEINGADIRGAEVKHLPIISAYASRIGLVEAIDGLLDCEMEVSPGRMVLAMILDSLSGRSPLFRMEQFFADQDVELLLGQDIPLDKMRDHTFGRVLDRLADVGTNKVLGAVIMGVMKSFDLDMSHVHHDTTSQALYGDYAFYDEDNPADPFLITHGFSKDHRPDLKQLVHSLLCVDHGIPIYSKLCDGNASDKNINRNIISEMVLRMRKLGREDFIYVADSALITKDNLCVINGWEGGCLFLSRLPMTYNECRKAIARAVSAQQWDEVGVISEQPATKNRKPASYKAFETTATLYGTDYRVIVVHSDAHDKRRTKRAEKEFEKDVKELSKLTKKLEKVTYACLPDAEAAAARLPSGAYHELSAEIEPVHRYARGRPKADGTRTITQTRYALKIRISQNNEAIQRARQEAGCFVLVTNAPSCGSQVVSAKQLLSIYKDQHMVESNFAFLKDPVFVNALFLKSPRRIEALGLVLILALLIWRLIERTMRLNLKTDQAKITGWVKRQTSRPTTFMMTTKFSGMLVLSIGGQRHLLKALNDVQLQYLKILGLTPEVFTNVPP